MGLEPHAFLKIAYIGTALHVLCAIAFRLAVTKESALFRQLFAQPNPEGTFIRGPWQMRTKYFAPWVASPETLTRAPGWVQAAFWGARIGGTLLFVGLVGILLSMLYIASTGHP